MIRHVFLLKVLFYIDVISIIQLIYIYSLNLKDWSSSAFSTIYYIYCNCIHGLTVNIFLVDLNIMSDVVYDVTPPVPKLDRNRNKVTY